MRRAVLGGIVGAVVATLGLVAVPGPADAVIVRVHRPLAPTHLVVTAANTAIAATWDAPTSDGGLPITRYIAKVGLKPCVFTGPTSCIVTGLKNGRAYSFIVRAVNALGNGRIAGMRNIIPTTAQNCSYVGAHANDQNCSLQYSDLTNKDLTGANLSGAYLTGANFTGATVTNANLNVADMTGETSSGLIGTPSALPTGWSLIGGVLYGPSANLQNLNLTGANLGGANLAGASLQYANLTGANLAGANLTGASLQYVGLTGANLTGANLTGAYLTGDTLDGVTVTNANLNVADLSGETSTGILGTPSTLAAGWNLLDGVLYGPAANLTGADMSGLDLSGFDLAGASLQSANFTNATLIGTNLSGASLQFATLTNADLAGADLTGAYLTLADFSGATLTGVTWSNTSCPDGTNSDSDGGTCIGFGI
jgi:uncharacterized protein YjbI with pentapeptide repeats